MMPPTLIAFLPEWILALGALVLFVITLGESRNCQARLAATLTAVAAIIATAFCLGQQAVLFDGAYRVDLFSQILKLALTVGFAFIVLLGKDLVDIRSEIRPEYFLFLTIHVLGLVMLVSSVDLITLVIALEVSSYPLYLMVAMRRELEGQRFQMESAIKYMMFGIAANGIMFFGMSYLFGITGTSSMPLMVTKLQPVVHTPFVIAGLAMMFCGIYYKLAVFPFHFWTPDVYQGASNETTSLIASLPKIGAVAVLVRFVSLATPDNHAISTLLTILAIASMFYGNLIALMQKDLKRLLGFSGIAHAGYALVGFTALSYAGYAASLYYIIGYMFMVLACFTVISSLSRDGANVTMDDLAGLHRRSPLLAVTLLTGVFALAGIPPFVGFIGKFSILTAALAKGHLALVIIAVLNTAIAIYYYLSIVRESCWRDPVDPTPIVVALPTRVLCLLLIAGNVLLGIAPGSMLEILTSAVACVNLPLR
ncbi:MAG: NADH-quinone oxidoreductase subunit N [Verrucomicrobiota bacterium]